MYLKIIIILSVIAYLAILKSKNHIVGSQEYDKDRKKLCVFTAILLILQSGLRHIGVGPDTYQYWVSFESHITWSWREIFQNFSEVYVNGFGKDAGYYLFVKLFSLVSTDYQVYLLFVATLIFVPFMRFIYKNTTRLEDIWLALLLYQALFYSFFSITGIRQSIATGLCLLSVEFIKCRKLPFFLLLIFIGALIHKSCLLFLPFYMIGNYKGVNKSFVIALLSFPLMVEFGRQFTLQLAVISGSENYLGYAEQESTGAKNLIFFYFIIAFVGFMRYWKQNEFKEYNRHIFNAISVGIFFLPLTLFSANLVRVVQYYTIFLLGFVGLVTSPKNDNEKIYSVFVKFVLIIALFYKIINTPAEYAFFWQNMEIVNY